MLSVLVIACTISAALFALDYFLTCRDKENRQ